jgi:DNA-binding PucR family transcriptional regulator
VLRPLPVTEVASRVLHALGRAAAIGQSAVAPQPAVALAWRQAAIALRVAHSRTEGETHAAWDALGADRLVARLDAAALEDVPQGLRHLLEHEPVLAHTLEVFLEASGDVQATAAALALHRSGVYYRLRRACELAELDLGRGEDRLLAHLALRLARLD